VVEVAVAGFVISHDLGMSASRIVQPAREALTTEHYLTSACKLVGK
jgi:hypothetical protein